MAQQWFIGPKLGSTYTYQLTKITGNSRADERIAPGFGMGLQATYSVNQQVAFLIEANYTQKNLTYKGNSSFTDLSMPVPFPFSNTSYTLVKNYLQMPLGIRLQTGGRLQVFTDAGGYAGYWLSGKWKVKEVDLIPADLSQLPADGSYPFQSATIPYTLSPYNSDGWKDQRLDLGVFLGFGVQYGFSWGKIWLEGRGSMSLSKLDQYQGTPPAGAWSRRQNTAEASAGISFALPH